MIRVSLTRPAALAVATLALATSARADIISFQDGLNSYTGTVDTTVFQSQPTNNNNTSANGFVGTQNSGQNQFLIRFDNIFGSGANQIPVGSTINSATLGFTRGPSGGFVGLSDSATTGNTGVRIHDLTAAFADATVNWDNAGTTANDGIVVGTDTDATRTGQAFSLSSANDATFTSTSVLSSLTEWSVTPASNFGWLVHAPASGVGNTNIRSSDATDFVDRRPILTIDFTPVPEPTAVVGLAAVAGLAMRRRRR